MSTSEKGLEKQCLSRRVFDLLKNSLPEMDMDIYESGGKLVLVCDFEPCRIYKHKAKLAEEKIAKEERYEKFWEAYRANFFTDTYYSTNISSKGITDMIDVRELIDLKTNQVIYIVPKIEWEKLGNKEFEFKNKGIIKALNLWLTKNPKGLEDQKQHTALLALAGRDLGQIVTVAAGIKPISIETDLDTNESLQYIVKNFSNLEGLVIVDNSESKNGHEFKSKEQVIYNLKAVERVIEANKSIFQRVNLYGKSYEEILNVLLRFYSNPDEGTCSRKDMYQAFGLLLGYDAKSCKDYRDITTIDWDEIFMSPDHVGSHPMNANPFNFYDTDYWISDISNNPDFQKLNEEYKKLLECIEKLLQKGLSPLETLSALNENSPEVLEELISDTKIKVEIAVS